MKNNSLEYTKQHLEEKLLSKFFLRKKRKKGRKRAAVKTERLTSYLTEHVSL